MPNSGWLALAFAVCACGSSLKPDRRAFLIAAEAGDVVVVREQLERGVGPDDILNRGDRSALYLAAMNAQVETVRVLLDAGADPNADREGARLQTDIKAFRALLKNVQSNPEMQATYRKQDGSTIELRSLSLHDQEYDQVLKLLDEAAASTAKK